MTQLTTPRPTAQRLVLPIVAVGVLLSGFDLFIVNVALGDIAAAMDVADLSDLSWVLNAYTIAFAALLVPAGRIGDLIGARRGFLAGLALFTAASALCAASPTLASLVAFRVVQAVGAALMIPSSLGLVIATAPPERRAGSVRLWAGLGGLGAALGPVVGGLLVHADWRWVFLINIPVGVAALVIGMRVLPQTPRHPDRRPGLAGALALVATVAALVTALVNGPEWGWSSPATLGLFALAAVGVGVNGRLIVRSASPIVDVTLLRVPQFAAMSTSLFVFHVAFGAMLLSAVLWLQDVWGYSALETGLGIAPGPLLVPFVAVGAGRVVAQIGARPTVTAGAMVFATGVAAWALLADGAGSYVTGFLPGILLTGIGVGLTVPTAVALGSGDLPPTRFSTGSAVLTTARQIGIAVGVAIVVAVLGSAAGTDAFRAAWWVTAVVAVLAAGTAVERRRA
ncbi:EmrB/QacA subfamily drug resistance transporter [Mumia flava]|uniref:EmrB/QacA subfamily drug resistance transporter n=1 Tax=Mumia flava TaxID=1348852 RepID=A0A0B2B2T6_9ACTN|nr:MFS transporter [Mumia flava]PJJ56126.1 EmrB/QacA subfamily drug resistance transporter [Mumia flava]